MGQQLTVFCLFPTANCILHYVYIRPPTIFAMPDLPNAPDDRKPIRLEYRTIDNPRDPREGRVGFWWVMLAAGWLPFLCGVISSRAVSQSGVAEIVRVHLNAGTAFMAMGILLSIASAIGSWRAAHRAAAGVAMGSAVLQVCSLLCVYGS